MTDEDDEFVRIEKESLWRKRQIEEDLGQPVYFKPKKEWVGLTDEEQVALLKNSDGKTRHWLVWQVEAKCKEKNHV